MIYDARSKVAAFGNRFKGKGAENIKAYRNAVLYHLDIPNIHAAKESWKKIKKLSIGNVMNNRKWLSELHGTGWMQFISKIMHGAYRLAKDV